MSRRTPRTTGQLAGRLATIGSASVAAAPGIYLGALTALSGRPDRCESDTSTRFAVVVPAHDEAPNIAATIASLLAVDYPTDRRRIVVIADNCTDQTAEVARVAGAEVIERRNLDERGKGHALRYAFDRLLADTEHPVDAVVVIDADTLVDHDVLRCASGHLVAGAQALQVDYRVRNPHDSWRTRLVDVAFTCNHLVRSAGRTRIGASCGLRGNGMVFTRATLEAVPADAFSVVEDLEYGIALAEAGIVVGFCSRSWVAGDMPSTAAGASSQRVRWEAGRSSIRRTRAPRLVRRAIADRSIVLGDLAADLLVPPLATVAVSLAVTTASAVGGRRRTRLPLAVATAGVAGLAFHVGAGIVRSQSGWRRTLPALARVPGYVVWKAATKSSAALRRRRSTGLEWTRTERSTHAEAEEATSHLVDTRH